MRSPNHRQPPHQTPPLHYGPDDVTEGYYELEADERNQTLRALIEHRDAVDLWYRYLTLYRRGMTGEWALPSVDDDKSAQTVIRLQGQLLGLGVSSAKAALDALLAGYYSVAFASIRHMLETFVQCLYVSVKPDEAARWYGRPGGVVAQAKTPGCWVMVDAVKQLSDMDEALLDGLYASWSLMSKGSHPTGLGIEQTVGDKDGRFYVLGATYDRHLCLTGFDHGLAALDGSLTALVKLRPQREDWRELWAVLRRDDRTWDHGLAVETTPAEGGP